MNPIRWKTKGKGPDDHNRFPLYGVTWDDINDATGFANGDLFQGESEVREYFTPASQRAMFPDAITDEKTLNAWADRVISNGWHVETREEQSDASF